MMRYFNVCVLQAWPCIVLRISCCYLTLVSKLVGKEDKICSCTVKSGYFMPFQLIGVADSVHVEYFD
jgi:hypothetical protein